MTTVLIPHGYCHCGCGQLAPISKKSHPIRGQVKGQPVKYIFKHHRPTSKSGRKAAKTRLDRLPPLSVRVFARVDESGGPDKCWHWTGYSDSNGYGVFMVARGVLKRAHRLVWELTNGPIADGLCVCHRCDNPACCNTAHLFLGTQADNMRDCVSKGRARGGSLKGAANPMSVENIAKRAQVVAE